MLKAYCERLGRDYATIEKTTLGTVQLASGQMSVADVIAQCRLLSGIGIQQAIFNMPNVHEIAPLVTFGKEISRLCQGYNPTLLARSAN